MEFMVTRASDTSIAHRDIPTMGSLLQFVKDSQCPVVINMIGDGWQLKLLDDPEALRKAQEVAPALLPSTIRIT